ncbi:Clp protease N-terminal domain-containing protein [Novipirellula caenicola]|uniref:Clp R domain-containing protein n=1 Tax=Novipirellula caenicola TaxID=1536901 RepID=A0ABP9VYX5_9BACT
MDQRVRDILALGRSDRTTDHAQTAVQHAVGAADEFGDSCVDSCHILLGLYLVDGFSVAANVLSHLELPEFELRRRLAGRNRVHCSSPLGIDDDVPVVFTEALAGADRMHHRHIGTEHLLLGVVASKTKSVNLLAGFGIAPDAVTHEVLGLMGWLR